MSFWVIARYICGTQAAACHKYLAFHRVFSHVILREHIRHALVGVTSRYQQHQTDRAYSNKSRQLVQRI